MIENDIICKRKNKVKAKQNCNIVKLFILSIYGNIQHINGFGLFFYF